MMMTQKFALEKVLVDSYDVKINFWFTCPLTLNKEIQSLLRFSLAKSPSNVHV